jgi:hypothetical protein
MPVLDGIKTAFANLGVAIKQIAGISIKPALEVMKS